MIGIQPASVGRPHSSRIDKVLHGNRDTAEGARSLLPLSKGFIDGLRRLQGSLLIEIGEGIIGLEAFRTPEQILDHLARGVALRLEATLELGYGLARKAAVDGGHHAPRPATT